MRVLAESVFRIGLQRLLLDEATGQHYMYIKNRTYTSTVPVPAANVDKWLIALGRRPNDRNNQAHRS